jgi:hypothetical protein
VAVGGSARNPGRRRYRKNTGLQHVHTPVVNVISGANNSGRAKAAAAHRNHESSRIACAASLVGAGAEPVTHYGDVILEVVGTGIVALGPLAKITSVAGAHDGSPATCAVVVFAVCRAVVTQSQIMAHLVRACLCDKVLAAVAKIVVVDEGGRIEGIV